MDIEGRERKIGANATAPEGPSEPAGPEQLGRRTAPNARARVFALGALALAAVLVLFAVLSSGQAYTVRLIFSDASDLVNGDQVFIGPSAVGLVKSINLTSNGQAAITIGLDSDAAPLRRGTVARIVDNGLAGVASHYVTIQPSAYPHAQIPSGGTIPSSDTYAQVGLDQLFNSLNDKTRKGLANVIQGQATAIRGKAQAANKTLYYLAPELQSAAQVTHELVRSEPAFDSLLVNGAKTMQTLASRSEELTNLVQKADEVTGAVASQSQNLQQTLSLLPGTLTKSTTTFAGLRKTLRSLDPLVTQSIPAVKQLKPFSLALDQFATTALPTVTDLADLIDSPSGNDLTRLLAQTPALEALAKITFPNIEKSISSSAAQIDYLRDYTPDIVAALSDLGQTSSYYDANGHYARSSPFFGAYGSAGGELTQRSPADRYEGLTVVRTGRCPGGATQAPSAADNSMPARDIPGCSAANVPPGK